MRTTFRLSQLRQMLSPRGWTFFALSLLILLGLGLRLWRLDESPAGALIDELHFGYIAYSLSHTGADEHGVAWPLVFEGFGDQKLPLYAYTLLPFVRWFGLSVMSIRLPSVLFGSLLIGAMYWLARALKFSRPAAWLAAVLTALSPWPFFLSRFGFESNAALAWWTMGLATVSTLQNAQPTWRKMLPAFFLALTWYSYIAYRPITLVLLVAYLAYRWWQKTLTRSSVGLVFITFFVLILPMLLPGVSGANTARLRQVGVLADAEELALTVNEKRTFCDWSLPKSLCYLTWNKPVLTAQTVISRFFETFSPNYLVLVGEGPAKYSTVEGYGQFAPVVYPFFLFGLFVLLINPGKKKQQLPLTTEHRWLLLFGLLLAVIPSALTSEPQKVRLSASLPFFVLVITSGVVSATQWWLAWQKNMAPKTAKLGTKSHDWNHRSWSGRVVCPFHGAVFY